MKLDFNLQISQKQGLALTAQVQQAIKLLQMTNMEICEFVEEQFQDNPFVEETSFTEKNKLDDPTNKTSKELDKSLEENPYKTSTDQSKISQENQFETGEAYTPRSTVAKEASDFDVINLVAAGKKSLYAHCLEFCDSLQLSPSENLVAQKLIEELEPTGWISIELKAIAEDLNLEDTLVSEVY